MNLYCCFHSQLQEEAQLLPRYRSELVNDNMDGCPPLVQRPSSPTRKKQMHTLKSVQEETPLLPRYHSELVNGNVDGFDILVHVPSSPAWKK